MLFRGPVRFVLHNGSQDPGWAASVKGVRYGPGGPLHAAVPGQSRPANQFLWGWTRDYFTVLANS